MLYQFPSDGLLCHIAVAGPAFDLSADVGGMVEANVGFLLEPVDAHPGDVFALLPQSGHLLNFGGFGGYGLVADHAEIRMRNSGLRPGFGELMAIRAFHPYRQMLLMGEGDGLLWCRRLEQVGEPLPKAFLRVPRFARVSRLRVLSGLFSGGPFVFPAGGFSAGDRNSQKNGEYSPQGEKFRYGRGARQEFYSSQSG